MNNDSMTNLNKPKKRRYSGFTIVELLIVIVIIGILAAITIVSYVGVSTKATEASLKSDLANASKKLQLYYVEHNLYPQDLDTNGCPTIPADTNYCIKPTLGNIFDYMSTTPYSDYTLTVEKGDAKYKILGSNTIPVKVNTTPITAIAAIAGTVKEGQILTAGTITPGGATVGYQWQVATSSGGTYTDISGATNNTYMPTSGDVGKYLKVQVTGTGDYRDSVTSAATTVVVANITPITSIAAISGTAQPTQTLTAGATTPAGATVSYQWQSATTVGGAYVNIIGATASTYGVSPAMAGKYIKVVVTGTGSYSGTQTSAATAQITADTTNWLTVGTQTWAKANLNIGTMIAKTATQTDNGVIEKFCVDDNSLNCSDRGGLYQWNEAMKYARNEKAQGICPAGSHVPSDNEWKILEMYLGMTQAQADGINIYRGTDQGSQLKVGGTSGLNFPYAGRYVGTGLMFHGYNEFSFMWSSTESAITDVNVYAYERHIYQTLDGVGRAETPKAFGLPVRCLGN